MSEMGHTGAMAVVSAERRRIVVAATVAMTSVGLSGVAFAPALLTYSPLLLIAMSAIPRHLVLAAPLTDPASFMIVATLRRVLGCTLLYFIGETFGDTGLSQLERRSPKARRFVRWIERLFARFGALLLVVAPSLPLSALAGNARIPLWQFWPAVSCGQLIWVGLTYWFGDFIGPWTAPFTTWLSEHALSTTIACMAAVAIYQLARRRQQQRRADRAVHGANES